METIELSNRKDAVESFRKNQLGMIDLHSRRQSI